jgi:hypothetical protein
MQKEDSAYGREEMAFFPSIVSFMRTSQVGLHYTTLHRTTLSYNFNLTSLQDYAGRQTDTLFMEGRKVI